MGHSWVGGATCCACPPYGELCSDTPDASGISEVYFGQIKLSALVRVRCTVIPNCQPQSVVLNFSNAFQRKPEEAHAVRNPPGRVEEPLIIEVVVKHQVRRGLLCIDL